MNLIESYLLPLTLSTALACGLMGGLFFAFSNFVMSALERIQPSAAMAAMQSINVTVLNPLFLAVFLGAGLLGLSLSALALMRWQLPGAPWLLAGGVLYVAGGVVVTMAFNVPLNDALAGIDPTKLESVPVWHAYVLKWRAWNHVRTLASLLAAASFMISLLA
jgi:uncharacterized membrane protein